MLQQLCMDSKTSPGKCAFTFLYSTIRGISRRIGRFNLIDQGIHERWLKPRLLGDAEVPGVKISVSDSRPKGRVVVSLAE